ncbi:AraC family transcriptional regulator [Aestuariibaculum sp. YM273]|uniref:AraC family transcriptional regulator n=1 Tax=Aestuariibaculum sp. YM273 TaxID=3070659 RepID=UPI0027DCF22A|nr:AraC family transcriptional regulator [Aestuariibaculum sp. YM273]WMI65232.1 AraC family transcriptional regulator [Aestuariibaculum sp. YM273]
MKVLPFKIPKPENEALVYQEERLRVLYDQLHQHSEIQISYVEKGAGTLIVGDTINDFSPNDILVLGSDVPHVFRTDVNFSEETVVYTLFFDRNCFGKHFFDLPDLESIHDFFTDSEYGMKILTRKNKLTKLFLKLKNQNKVQRIGTLLRIIDHITKAEKTAISSFVYKKKYTDDEGKRMNDVFNYAMENYMEPITLEEISEVANMSKNAFCRYFKKRTNKTFFQFLIEIRIENACKLIYNNPDHSISSISELCGFQNTANFNRKFKEIKGVTPSHFRLQRF